MSEKPCAAWLPPMPDFPQDMTTPRQAAERELSALGISAELDLVPDMGDGYEIRRTEDRVRVAGGAAGVLYGAYALIESLRAGLPAPEGPQMPACGLRMLNCWDNADGSIERGYAGDSLWFDGGRMAWEAPRILQLGRMLASVGINALCVNNVNVKGDAQRLIGDWLPELARLAALFRPFGVRLMIAVNFAQPVDALGTADPLDERVIRWWTDRAEAVWRAIPDLAGFLVKADSEHRPGPFTYGRTHAEGANMLARAVAPHGGVLVWRAFVYNCRQDWRDTRTDRPKAAYDTYAPLDGKFDDNVILQVKYGPFDFQPREPVSPALLGMPRTRLALELQLTQEYTGHQIDLFAMNPMWRELAADLPMGRIRAVAAVSNLGRDENYTGHPFAAVNLYGYGRFAWDPECDPGDVIRRWARLTYRLPAHQEAALADMLLHSREVYEQYTAPLGLCWMVVPGLHYGPSPEGYEYDLWGTYHRASRDAVGIDRTARGTGYTLQYPEWLRARYEDPTACPDEMKLFFHRLPYDFPMSDGRSMIQRIYDDHFEGAEKVEAMAAILATLDLPGPDRAVAKERMEGQLRNAREWRDVINTYFHRLSGIGDARGRRIYD